MQLFVINLLAINSLIFAPLFNPHFNQRDAQVKIKKLVKQSVIGAAFFFAAGLAYSQDSAAKADQFKESLAKMAESCEEHGSILADAQFNKWKKQGRRLDLLSDETYLNLKKIMQQQCVSVQYVAIMRIMKSYISASEALRLDIDGQIDKHMLLIERSL